MRTLKIVNERTATIELTVVDVKELSCALANYYDYLGSCTALGLARQQTKALMNFFSGIEGKLS